MVRRYLPLAVLLLMALVEIGCCRHRCWLQQRRQARNNHVPACECAPSNYYPSTMAPPVMAPFSSGTSLQGAPTKMPAIPTVTEQLPGPKPGPIPNL